MQSEGGAAGALHGAVQTGALATTFTASQGLLLMIPTMFKMAGELMPAVFHVSARSVATQALSIFGDHSDVMAVRSTGFAMLASGSPQEASDLALVAHASSLKCRLPIVHFFDGFRTSHEVTRLVPLERDTMRTMVGAAEVREHRERGLSPEHPVVRGTSHNPDTFFQARERSNGVYHAAPGVVQSTMDRLAEHTSRAYHLFDYVGAPDATRVLVMMGSGCSATAEAVRRLVQEGDKVGLIKVRLYRPFSIEHFLAAVPASVRAVAVLDRTKEPGSVGEPLYQDVVTAFSEGGAAAPKLIGGRYGLSSKEYTPAMAKAVFDELLRPDPRRHFTVGIDDDVTHLSLDVDATWTTEDPSTLRAVFYGLGADGTVGANKNTIKIIGEQTDNFAQGYFVYDSKKSGSMTVSHLRFGPHAIDSPYLIREASFVACHQFSFLSRVDVLDVAAPHATLLLNSPHDAEHLWPHLPVDVQDKILLKGLRVYTIDALRVAREAGLGTRINTIMQTCFFALCGILSPQDALAAIKASIRHTYGRLGMDIVERNFGAVDAALAHLQEVALPGQAWGSEEKPPVVSAAAPRFVQDVIARMLAGHGDTLPVSAMPLDGTWPVGTSRCEKRSISDVIPAVDHDLCIQCGKCVMVCPHAVLRAKVYGTDRDRRWHMTLAPSRRLLRPHFQHLLDVLQDDGWDVIGPTVRDGVIVYDSIQRSEDLPQGWTDEQEAGRYRLKRRDDDAWFGYAVGPHSWKKVLHPAVLRLFFSAQDGDRLDHDVRGRPSPDRPPRGAGV
jgi:pyruvate-ferredoxin/flavodoxin oxidoreductase